MTTTLEPQLQTLAEDLKKIFTGGPGPSKNFATVGGDDSAKMAAAFVSAYHAAATVNPQKAFKSKGAPAALVLTDSTAVADKGFWDDAWAVVRAVAPVVINALSKDYKPAPATLKQIVDALPAERKNDKAWTDYATNTLLYGCWQTASCFGGTVPRGLLGGAVDMPPTPPPGADKNWLDDVVSFIEDAAPVVLPIVLSLI